MIISSYGLIYTDGYGVYTVTIEGDIMENNAKRFGAAGVLFAAAIGLAVLGGCNKTESVANAGSSTSSETGGETETAAEKKEYAVQIAQTGTGVTVTKADDWAETFPYEYASYMENNDNSEVVEYTEENPYIQTVYEGYGFAISYGSARGHTYDIEDLYATGRPHKLANCFTCKTADFTASVLNNGDSMYSTAFEDFTSEVTDPFGCFHCHEDDPTSLTVTHLYLANALGDDVDTVAAQTLSCGQCHSEYYFDPETKATSFGYTSIDGIGPQDILAYENAIVDTEGNQFADWVDESTGVRKLKAQHPEFETYINNSTHYSMGLTCADCHMEKATAEDGTAYTSHNWVSPLDSESIMSNTCAQCHGTADVTAMVESIQTATTTRENEIGEKLVELDTKLSEAVANNTLSEEDLETVRSLNRDGQFLWDFVYVENSEGFHNTSLTEETLDKAEELIDEALAMLGE